MKRLLVLVLLAAGLAVTPSATHAASGCGTVVFPPAYGNVGYARAICTYLTQIPNDSRHSERVRVYIYCQDPISGHLAAPIYSAWQWAPNTWTANAYCSTRFPVAGVVGYETAIG